MHDKGLVVRRTNGRATELSVDTLEELEGRLYGGIYREDEPEFEEARTIWNAMIDTTPAMVLRCSGTADVAAAMDFVREHGLLFSIKGAGHNIAGKSLCEGGVVIDLSHMKGIYVDPAEQTARVEPGVVWGELDRETQLHELATPGGIVSTTGTSGFTLGGGFGWLTRKYGYTCDNLMSAEVVTVEGDVVNASEQQHPELFWGLRGGGGNFGIVTSFEYRLHPLPDQVLAGMVLYSMDDAEKVLRGYADIVGESPEELGSLALLRLAPPAPFLPEEVHGAPVAGIVVCWAGPLDQGEDVVRPLRELAEPIVDGIGPKPYTAHQKMLDTAQPAGRRHYWKSDYLGEIEDEAVDRIAKHARTITSPHTGILLMHLHGAGNRIPSDATAYGHRDTSFVLNIGTQWIEAAEDEEHIRWTRAFWEDLHPFAVGTYGNFLTADDDDDRVRQAYGANYERLARLKAEYDPDNLFRLNQNIPPSRG
jgi:FAD/FMN-containing dehydrogenase